MTALLDSSTFRLFHVAISLIAIFSGTAVMYGLLAGGLSRPQRLEFWP